ncbi:MAG TPA: MFS transporter, partial [Polyangiaceae bacterium]|nr:MFS transporter [Polyangiaceae bacterium]
RHMNNLRSARSNLRDQLAVARSRHTWVMAWLYIGTFGSFIGYSAAFPLLLKMQFPQHTGANLAFLGPLVGSLARPLGGWLSDRYGGTRITFVTFLAMGVATVAVIYFVDARSFAGFLATFMVLFVTTGMGNGSTFRMIPLIFKNAALASGPEGAGLGREGALRSARIESAAAIGLVSAIGACGGYLVPRGFAASIAATGSVHGALTSFLLFYVACMALTWAFYIRQPAGALAVATEARV